MSDRRPVPHEPDPKPVPPTVPADDSLLGLIDRCLAALPEGDPKQKWLYRIRHLVLQEERTRRDIEAETQKLKGVVEKLTAPANRIGVVVGVPGSEAVRLVVGGAEYWAGVDPRLDRAALKVGVQVLVNEAFAVINVLGYETGGPVFKVVDGLPDGRIRIGQEPGGQSSFVIRGADLVGVEIRAGDEVRVDASHRVAVERLESKGGRDRVLDEVPDVTWADIGGQGAAIAAIRKSIEAPLLHADTFAKFGFKPPKGFLLYGPPGCGKTMIGKATAASLAASLAEKDRAAANEQPVRGAFLHVKGPEILNMWLGESERLVRDLFAQARARRAASLLPVIFIDEAESILGTRRSMRALNIANTLVPMFCAEMDGVASLREVVIILASNRPDLIDPAILRPGRIDRKIKVGRPSREDATEILRIHLGDAPLDPAFAKDHGDDQASARAALATAAIDRLFARDDASRVLAVRLRSGLKETMYRGDVISGAILASVAQRVKECAVERQLERGGEQGIRVEDIAAAIDAEFAQGEILPPDDAAEEWLKLLDHHPQQVVGVASFRGGRESGERPVHVVI